MNARTLLILGGGCAALLVCGGGLAVVGAGAVLYRRGTAVPAVATTAAPTATATEADEENYEALQKLMEARPKMKRGDPIPVASPRRVKEAVPARYTKALAKPPIEAYWSDPKDAPPVRMVTDLVCTGNAKVRKQWVDALESAAAGGATPFELGDGYGDFLSDDCRSEEFCRFAAASARAAKHPNVREHLWELATGYECGQPALASVFLEPKTPPSAAVSWITNRPAGDMPAWDARWGDALRAWLASGVEPDPDRIYEPLTNAAEAFVRFDDAKANDALLAAHGAATAEQKRFLAIGMSGSSDARLFGLYSAACARAENAERCEGRADDREELRKQLTTEVADFLEDPELDVLRFVDRNPAQRTALLSALKGCDDLDSYYVETCLLHFARLDWTAARRHAQHVRAKDETARREQAARDGDDELADLVADSPIIRTLLRFETRDAMVADLRSRGFGDVSPTPRDVTALPVLARTGRVAQPTFEEEFLDPDHAHVARRIAIAAGPALEGVQFAAPKCVKGGESWEACEVVAWMDGERWSVDVISSDGSYDMPMVTALVNALLIARKSDLRALSVEDWSVPELAPAVLVAPESALRGMIRDRLLDVAADEMSFEYEYEYEEEEYEDESEPE